MIEVAEMLQTFVLLLIPGAFVFGMVIAEVMTYFMYRGIDRGPRYVDELLDMYKFRVDVELDAKYSQEVE